MIIKKDNPDSIRRTINTLLEKKLVIIPTDTIYGISGIVPDTAQKIIQVKGRDDGKPFIQLISDPEDIVQYSKQTIKPSLLALWPDALTIIVNSIYGGTIALRCPGDAWLRSLIGQIGKPIFSTSVNRAGQIPLTNFLEICNEFSADVELIIDDGDSKSSIASTIIDATGANYQIVRQGGVIIPSACLINEI